MSRFSTYLALLVGACCLLLVAPPGEAATKKKSPTTSKKGKASTSTKKKTPSSAPKIPAEAGAAAGAGAAPGLDLPLPDKADPSTKPPAPPVPAATPAPKPAADSEKKTPAPNATIEPESLVEFSSQSPRVQQLIRDAIDLTRLNLTYTFGSADPDAGGMDCSGTIFYLLKAHGFSDAARDSRAQYLWARKSGGFYPVLSKKEDSAEFAELLPGDLLFWTGTYEVADQTSDLPISHVMLYLGREKEGDRRVMFGASNGRSYRGVARNGVSVFDFRLPKFDPAKPANGQSTFVGFARLPGLRTAAQLAEANGDKTKAAEAESAKDAAKPTPKPKPTPTPKKTTTSKKRKK